MKAALVTSISHSLGRAATAVPMTLLALFAGVLWLIGLCCGKERRTYVVKLNSQIMAAISSTLSPPEDQVQSQETAGAGGRAGASDAGGSLPRCSKDAKIARSVVNHSGQSG